MKFEGSRNLILIATMLIGTAWVTLDRSWISETMKQASTRLTDWKSTVTKDKQVADSSAPQSVGQFKPNAVADSFQWVNDQDDDSVAIPKELSESLNDAAAEFAKKSDPQPDSTLALIGSQSDDSFIEPAGFATTRNQEMIEGIVESNSQSQSQIQSLWGTDESAAQEVADLLDELPNSGIDFAELPGLGGDNSEAEADNQFQLQQPLVITALPPIKLKNPNKLPKHAGSNPNWWVQSLHNRHLRGRNPVRTTLDEVIFLALQNAPQIQILNTQPKIQETVVGESIAAFDWTHFITSQWNDQNEPLGSSLTVNGGQAGQRFIQRDWTFENGVRKQLLNGASVSVGQQIGTFDNNSDFLVPPDQGNAQLVLDYRQPLLQGRGRQVATSQIALASLDLKTISNDSLSELQGYLIEVVESYWDVYLQRALLIQNIRSTERAGELLRQLRLRDGIDVRNDQLLRAEAAFAARNSQVIRSEYELINAQDRLINLTLGPNSTHADSVELIPDLIGFSLGIEFQPEQIVQAAIHNRPEVHRSIAQIRAGSIRYNLAKNQLLPRLDAIVSSQVAGLRGDKNIIGSFQDQFTVGTPSYSVGFEYELPLGNRAAKRRLERSQLEAEVLYREFQKEVGDVVLDARIASRRIIVSNKQAMNNWNALQKAEEELRLIQERQRLNLDNGKTGSLYIEDLLASQARLTTAEARMAQSQTEQAIALVDLKRATGALLRDQNSNMLPVSYAPIIPGYGNGGNNEAIEPAGGFNYPYSADVNFDPLQNQTIRQVNGTTEGFNYPNLADAIPADSLPPTFGYPDQRIANSGPPVANSGPPVADSGPPVAIENTQIPPADPTSNAASPSSD